MYRNVYDPWEYKLCYSGALQPTGWRVLTGHTRVTRQSLYKLGGGHCAAPCYEIKNYRNLSSHYSLRAYRHYDERGYKRQHRNRKEIIAPDYKLTIPTQQPFGNTFAKKPNRTVQRKQQHLMKWPQPHQNLICTTETPVRTSGCF